MAKKALKKGKKLHASKSLRGIKSASALRGIKSAIGRSMKW
jgi:hypothetical protein